MDWEYICERCGAEYCTGNPEPWGLPKICFKCWKPKDEERLQKYYKDYDARAENNTAEQNLNKIPKWIRRIFGAYTHTVKYKIDEFLYECQFIN